MIVAEGNLGALCTGYLLAARGRRVGVVERSLPTGTTAVSVVSAGWLEPLRGLVDRAPVVARQSAVMLQPEGGLSVGMTSERFTDAAHAVAIVDRAAVATALVEAIDGLGGLSIPAGGAPSTDASGAVVGWRNGDDTRVAARCSLLSSADVLRLAGMRAEPPEVPPWALETEWRHRLDAGVVRARFSLGERGAAEWWLYGDPLDGARGLGWIRAFDDTVSIGVVVPLDEVLDTRIDIDDLGGRLRAHPLVAPLLEGGVLREVSGTTSSMTELRPEERVGDGWLHGPVAHPFDAAPLSTEIAMATVIAESVDGALRSGRVTSARLADIPRRLRAVGEAASLLPTGPIDGWADELAVEPTRLVEGLRAMAVRFSRAR